MNSMNTMVEERACSESEEENETLADDQYVDLVFKRFYKSESELFL
jgi:hypothetical protein